MTIHELDVDYQSRTYEDLSHEFQNLYPSARRAFQLIPAMYNRLTLVDNLSHKAALTKLRNDHKHLSGFSMRNIYRYLPSDNLHIPRRIMTPRHKTSKANDATVQSDATEAQEVKDESTNRQNDKDEKDKRIQELENELKQRDHDMKDRISQNEGLLALVEFLSEQLQLANKGNNMNQYPYNNDAVDFEFRLPWEMVRAYMTSTFKSRMTFEVWFHGKFDKLTGNVIEAYIGR
jgi:hypothetical protein